MARKDQYFRKIEFILEKINDLPENLTADKFYIDALFYRLHTSIEAFMDIIAMLCKDFGILVGEDYHNIDEIGRLDLFSPSEIAYFRKLNGLRNVIVHKYNKIEERLIIEELEPIIEFINHFAERVEAIVNKLF